MTLHPNEESATPSAWMMLDLVLALRQVAIIARYKGKSHPHRLSPRSYLSKRAWIRSVIPK
jgi:hypothetical protein